MSGLGRIVLELVIEPFQSLCRLELGECRVLVSHKRALGFCLEIAHRILHEGINGAVPSRRNFDGAQALERYLDELARDCFREVNRLFGPAGAGLLGVIGNRTRDALESAIVLDIDKLDIFASPTPYIASSAAGGFK